MKEDKNRDAVDTELKELEDDQEVTKFAKKFIAEHKKTFDVLKDKWISTQSWKIAWYNDKRTNKKPEWIIEGTSSSIHLIEWSGNPLELSSAKAGLLCLPRKKAPNRELFQ